ncbi:MAG: ribonuclease HI [Acutalibacteraceae bacterium]
MKTVYIFTDGACSGNPGPGGWGAILRYGQIEKRLSGGEKMTTNNRMELTAVIRALGALKEKCHVVLTTDSKYVCDGINKGWAASWKKNGWRKSDKKPALNPELWDELLSLTEKHDVNFIWVKGHNGHPENEICDKMAVSEWQKFAE